MLPVSQKFIAAQAADANLPVSQVFLVLGNYASAPGYGATAASSGDDGSGNFPASGAVDGDRTELNVGAASGADNDVGKSSWKSSGIPDNGDTVTLTVTFSQSRTCNRVKLYNLSGHGLKTYKLSWWNGSSYVDFAATADIVAAGQTTIFPSFRLDIVDFPDVTTTKIRLTITHTQVSMDPANVVELEVYRRIDITDRVSGVSLGRQRDYKLRNPLATTAQLQLNNDDRFFSPSHTPTAAEVTAGFINSDLKPGIGIQVYMGFNYLTAVPETTSLFVGELDRLSARPKSRDAVMECRDYTKRLINKLDSSKLKTSNDISANILYVLNRTNISTYETNLASTPISINYFFTDQQDILSTVRDLTQAAGDAAFFFDENGTATFQYYATATALSHTYTSEADFEAGVLANISTHDGTDALEVPVLFQPTPASGTVTGQAQADGGLVDMPQTDTTFTHSPTSFNNITTATQVASPYTNSTGVTNTLKQVSHPATTVVGVNALVNTVWLDSGGSPGAILFQDFSAATNSPCNVSIPAGATVWIGVVCDRFATITQITWARRVIGGPQNWITGQGKSFVSGTWVNTFDTDNSQNVSYNVSAIVAGSNQAKSGTWTSPIYDSFSTSIALMINLTTAGTFAPGTSGSITAYGSADGVTFDVNYAQSNPNGTYNFVVVNRRYWKIVISLSSNAFVTSQPSMTAPTLYFDTQGTWTSPFLDTGAGTTSFGQLDATFIPNGGTVTFLTASSADNVTYEAFVPLSGINQIQSTVHRYIKVKAIIMLSGDLSRSPSVLDITVNWVSATGTPKYPASASITVSFDSTLLDLEQQLADNLGGDSSIANDVSVQAQPLVLTGADADTVWQGTVGTPPVKIDGSNTLSVANGQVITIAPQISGGMDVSRMSGADPAALVVTFASSATGSWVCTSAHPTLPVFVITITHAGTITDLRVTGKTFQSASYIEVQTSKDVDSIALYGDRQLSINNKWINSKALALSIASTLVTNYKNQTSYIPRCEVRPTFSAQLGDRVTVSDFNTDLSADYQIVGLAHMFQVGISSADVKTDMTLIKIPV